MFALALERQRMIWITVGAITLAAATAIVAMPGESGVRAAIALTARTSLALFLSAFSASSLARLLPGDFTRWLLCNRRYLGLSFAASHGLHALVIALFALQHPASFAEHTRERPIGAGLIAYLFIIAMAATSNDRALHWLGPRRWKLLHGLGGLYIWVAFFKATFTRTSHSAGYWLPVGLLTGALVLRLYSSLTAAFLGTSRSRKRHPS